MNIYNAISQCMAEIGAIGKDKTNSQQGFKYRGVDDVMNALSPVMVKNKIFVVPEVLELIREDKVSSKGNKLLYTILKIQYTFFADDGSNVIAVVIGEAMDSADKSANKAMSVAFKYACFQVFCIPTEEMIDPDSETHDLKRQQAAKQQPPTNTTPPEPPKVYECFSCKKPFTDFTHNGKKYTAGQAFHMSENKYGGKAYCFDCGKTVPLPPKEIAK